MIPENGRRILFPGNYNIESFQRAPNRPLPEISTFVVEKMPTFVRSIQTTKRNKRKYVPQIEEFALAAEEKIITTCQQKSYAEIIASLVTPEAQELALFDLIILQSALTTVGKREAQPKKTYRVLPSRMLTSLITDLSTAIDREVTTLTYADVIFTNPLDDDPRTFLPLSTPEGREELDFYETHARIEKSMRNVLGATVLVTDALLAEGVSQVPFAENMLRAVGLMTSEEFTKKMQRQKRVGSEQASRNNSTDMDVVLSGMTRVGIYMDPDRFSAFRPFFNPYPDLPEQNPAHFDGASGKFSASFPTWELLLSGDNLPDSRHSFNSRNYRYFSTAERELINAAYKRVEKNKTLDGVCESIGDPQIILDLLHGADMMLKEFRIRHRKGVAKQIPGALSGQVAGTGGEQNISQFLDERRKFDLIRRPRE